MPIQAYVKTAASNLRQAAQALNRDISNAQQMISQETRQHEDTVIRLRQRRRDSENEVSRTDNQNIKQQKVQEIAAVKQQEIETERDKDSVKRQLQGSVGDMESVVSQLNRYASELENLASRVT